MRVHSPETNERPFRDSTDDSLLAELKRACPPEQKGGLFVSWHGDSHLIADDKRKGGRWKEESPAFRAVIKEMERYFPGFHIQATRFNWYRDDSEWKPYHHDAAAIKPRFAKIQNITVAASFGATRDASFQHARHTDVTLDLSLPNGSMYAFSRETNKIWKHGITAAKKPENNGGRKGNAKPGCRREVEGDDKTEDGGRLGRISIIAWGWMDQEEEDGTMRKRPDFDGIRAAEKEKARVKRGERTKGGGGRGEREDRRQDRREEKKQGLGQPPRAQQQRQREQGQQHPRQQKQQNQQNQQKQQQQQQQQPRQQQRKRTVDPKRAGAAAAGALMAAVVAATRSSGGLPSDACRAEPNSREHKQQKQSAAPVDALAAAIKARLAV